MTQAAPTEAASQPTGEAQPTAPEAVSLNRLPTLADQVRVELDRQKAEHRAKRGNGAAPRDESGKFAKADEDEAAAAREDGDRRRPAASKAKGFDDAKAEELEEREAAGEKVEPEPEDEKAEPGDEAKAEGPKGSPKAARWRVKLKRGEERLQAFQSQLSDQARQIADMKREVEAKAKELEARAARLAEVEALEKTLADDPLALLYQRKVDPEQLVLRHYERVKAGTAGQAAAPASAAQLPPEVREALAEVAELKKRLAEAEAKKADEAKAQDMAAARNKFLGLISEESHPDLDAYRDVKGDDDVIHSAFGEGGAAYDLEARLGRPPSEAEVLKELNKRAAEWLSARKIAKRFAGRAQPADSGREPEARPAPKPEGEQPTSKTLSNRQVTRGTPPRTPDFGNRADTTAFLVDALRARPHRLDAWR